LNVDKSIVSAGNSVLEVLRNAPGVRVVGDEVLFKGGQKALIAVNGKPVLLTGEQLSEMLKNYQSSMISQVELIENPSAKYDAAGGGVINIILKKNRDLGLRATITESGSIGQKYKLSTAANLNYRTKNINLFGSYVFAKSEIPRNWIVNRKINTGAGVAGYDMDYTGTTKTNNNSFNVGADFILNAKQNIGILFNGFVNPNGIDKENTTRLSTNGRLDSSIITRSFIDRHIKNLNYNINYRGVFGKKGQHVLSADADYSQYNRTSLEDLDNAFTDAAGATYRAPLFFLVNSPADINVRSAKIDYTWAASAQNTFEAGLKLSKVKSINKIDFKEMQSGGGYQLVPELTDHFVYNEIIDAGYVNYIGKFGKWSVTAGVRVEETKANRKSFNPNRVADTSYFNIFPTVQVNYDVNDDHQLSFSYNRRIARPNYQDLNPFVGYVDQYTYSVGNPFLRPQYTSNFQLSDIYLIKFKGALGVNITKDFYTTVFNQDNATGRYTTTKDNIGSRYQYMAEVTAPFDLTPWWQITNYAQGTYEHYAYTIPGAASVGTWDLLVRLTQNFSITKKFKAEVNGSYETPTYFGIKYYREQYFFSAGLSHNVLHDQGILRLAVSDIFNTQIDRYNTRFINLDLRGREKVGSRFVTATFTYRFGNNTLKAARKRTGGISDEQTRLSGSNSEN
jgi:iron complex outermembrane receptor protein